MVGYMGWVIKRPSLTLIEVSWRWIFGIPLLAVCWIQWQRILAAFPLENSGFNSIDAQNPWVAIVQLTNVWTYYEPHVFAVLRWLLPFSALAWVVISGVGRNLVIKRMAPHLRFRPFEMIVLQAAWLALMASTFWAWYRCMQWAAVSHISATGDPDVVGFAIWGIVLTLAFFTAWGLMSWALSVAPLLMLLEGRSVLSSLGQSLRLGKSFAGKLTEINVAMGIVKLALIVLAMVFSAAPLPFGDQLGASALHVVWAASTIFYLVANDYFQVVRLKGFVEFWKVFRGSAVS